MSSGPVVGRAVIPVVGMFLAGAGEVDGFGVEGAFDGDCDGATDVLFEGETEGDELVATSEDFLGVGWLLFCNV